MTTMTTSTGGRVPEFTLGWRMRLALETEGISVQEMAERLGYSRSTISRWLNDQDAPRAVVLDRWRLETGVDEDWLRSGAGVPQPPDGPGRSTDQLAALTEAKKARSGRARRSTDQYFSPTPVAA